MKITQVNLKTNGDIKDFQILKSIGTESSIDNWKIVIEATKNEKNYYELELNEQKFRVFSTPKIFSENKKIYAQDIDDSNNQIILKSSINNLFLMKQWVAYFQNNENFYSLSSVPSGIKGYIYPIMKNNNPVAVFCQSNTQINGNFQLNLYTIDNQSVDEIVALFFINYMSLSPDFLDLGILSAKNSFFYSFSGRKNLTKTHIDMLPVNNRPLKIEASLWILIGVLLIIGVAFIKPIIVMIFISVWIILVIINFFKNLMYSKETKR